MNREMSISEEPWINLVPSNWGDNKIKYVAPIHNERAEANNGYIGLENIESWTGKIIPSDSVATGDSVAFRKNDVLFGKLRPYLAKSVLAEKDGCGSTELLVMRPEKINPNYLKYIFLSKTFVDRVDVSTYGAKMPRANNAFIGNLRIPLPPEKEQHAIVTYLDAKCSAIDEAIERHKKIIEKMEEYRTAIISVSVTRGLNLNTALKNSGVEFIGDIPENWEISKLMTECYVRARLGWRGLKAEEYVEEGYAFISAFNIQGGKLIWEPLNFITKERYDESPEIKISIGDILLVKDGAGVGKSARVNSLPKGETSPNSSLAVITPNEKYDYRFVHYYLLSKAFNGFVQSLYNGLGVPHLTHRVMRNIKMPLPPIRVQHDISDYLDDKCSGIDNAIERHNILISKLEEYRKSLIYNAVTGKIDCREEAAG